MSKIYGNKNIKLSKEAKIIIIDNALGKIIQIFLTTFLASYFYKISEQNMVDLSLYYIITFIVATIGAVVFANYIKTKNKMNLYRLGAAIKAIYIFTIILMKEQIINHIYLIGFMYGITIATTGFPLNMIESEQVEEDERCKYLGYKSAVGELVSLVIPVLLGAYISFNSYEIAAILIFIFSIIKLFFTFFIKNKNMQTEKVDLFGFAKILSKDNILKKLYMIEFLKGITVYGALSLIVSLLIIYELKTDLQLGIWTSLFSVMTIIGMMLFSKYYNKGNSKLILGICFIAILLSYICILISINIYTIIIYNIVYYIFVNILLNITEANLFNYSNVKDFKDKYNTEYFIFRELFLNLARIISYSLLLVVGISQNMNLLKVLLMLISIALFLIIKNTSTLSEKITFKE